MASIEKTNKHIIDSQKLRNIIANEFIEIYKISQAISITKGKSHYLSRNSKLKQGLKQSYCI